MSEVNQRPFYFLSRAPLSLLFHRIESQFTTLRRGGLLYLLTPSRLRLHNGMLLFFDTGLCLRSQWRRPSRRIRTIAKLFFLVRYMLYQFGYKVALGFLFRNRLTLVLEVALILHRGLIFSEKLLDKPSAAITRV